MVSGVKEAVKGGCEVTASILRLKLPPRSWRNHFLSMQQAVGEGGAWEASGCEVERHFKKEISNPQAKLFMMPLLLTDNLL